MRIPIGQIYTLVGRKCDVLGEDNWVSGGVSKVVSDYK